MGHKKQYWEKCPKSTSDTNLCTQKPAATSTFCKQNVSSMNHIEMVIWLTFRLRIGNKHCCQNGHVIHFFQKIKVCIVYKDNISHLIGLKKLLVIIEFFVQNLLIWNILCCCFKNWLLGYFSHSIFVKECRFSFKILKWQQRWKFSEFQRSAYKIVIFWSIHPKLNFLYSNECVNHGFSACLGF